MVISSSLKLVVAPREDVRNGLATVPEILIATRLCYIPPEYALSASITSCFNVSDSPDSELETERQGDQTL